MRINFHIYKFMLLNIINFFRIKSTRIYPWKKKKWYSNYILLTCAVYYKRC